MALTSARRGFTCWQYERRGVHLACCWFQQRGFVAASTQRVPTHWSMIWSVSKGIEPTGARVAGFASLGE